ncbi:hypothetical protein CHLRE_13g578676v5 [Chlamydomonas reinhardtii]|uniref:Uncharacterized protein n=1 Tax=Chlamydomonas reinhardtii TaxID=3055 RepID=A0A2K3D083_CHLRE|nr:uncharacterized protein CHLRE_13g578676v5 [Chlamydomonas reinhardtii]PNW73931.1 hypothetical protein CHLRE_13g578676v5 [Chlamydomonas reinhardtii]
MLGNRDLNAAANIRLIAACVEDGTPYPAALSRPPKRRGWISGSGVQISDGGGVCCSVCVLQRGGVCAAACVLQVEPVLPSRPA